MAQNAHQLSHPSAMRRYAQPGPVVTTRPISSIGPLLSPKYSGRPSCITSSTASQIWPKLPVPSMPSTSGRLSRMSFSYRCDRQPVTRIFFSPPAFFTSASCRIWSMASLLALSIKPQVLTMATSHPSTSPTTSWPAWLSR